MAAPALVGQRYLLLETIGMGGMGTVYRAKDRFGGLVALKRLKATPGSVEVDRAAIPLDEVNAPTEDASLVSPVEQVRSWARARTLVGDPTRRVALAREFHMLSSLRHPNIIGVLDYGFDEHRQPFYTMELLDGAQPVLKAAADQPEAYRLRLLAELLRAVRYLHRRGVVHRDLKPSNVLVAGDHVRVLDFGLATLQTELDEDRPTLSGTPAYMAPELFQRRPPTPASDLFAVGVMVYELLAGESPFPGGAYRAPDLTRLDARIAPVVARLLAEHPEDRYSDATEVLHAIGRALDAPLAIETTATRESALKAALFVGREAELERLSSALDAVLAGRGDAWLVGGESGVGKSRLLEELRALALVRGAVVITGQAVREGGGPHLLFRSLARWLAILAEPDAADASVLLPLVPELPALLDREVPPAPELGPDAAQLRLHATIDRLLRRLEQPAVLLLEDLQWAGSDSLRLLERVAGIARELPVLVLATYRDDERPELARELPSLSSFKLERIGPESIAELSRSMIGASGARPDLVVRLQRETEGNPYFLIELVRALAERAGRLDAIGAEALPERLMPTGLYELVKRRLARVPPSARPLLELAAVAGRRVDPSLLAAVEPSADVGEWLAECTSAVVIDVEDGEARFAHDKLREGVLAELDDERRRSLHARLADTIERLHAGDAEYAAALAHHFSRAGRLAQASRYSGIAAEQALASGAYVEAIQLFEQAASQLAPDTDGGDLLRVRWRGRMAEALGHSGDQPGAAVAARRALRDLGFELPETPLAYVADALRHAAAIALHRLQPSRGLERDPARRALLGEGVRTLNRLTASYFYAQDSLPLVWSGLGAVRVGERAGPSAQLGRAYASIGLLAGILGMHRLARTWLELGIEQAERADSPQERAITLHLDALHCAMTADWERHARSLRASVAIVERNGDRRQWDEATAALALGFAYRGRAAEGVRMLAPVEASARARADRQSIVWSAQVEALCRMRLGETVLAQERLEQSRELGGATAALPEQVNAVAPLALIALRLDDRQRARALAEEALALLANKPMVAYWVHHSIDALADTVLSLWEIESSPRSSPLGRLAAQACRAAQRFARMFILGRASALLWDGWFAQLSGSPGRARRLWRSAAAEAQRRHMPYQEARAHLELGIHSTGSARREHLGTAARIFEQLGAQVELARARAAMR